MPEVRDIAEMYRVGEEIRVYESTRDDLKKSKKKYWYLGVYKIIWKNEVFMLGVKLERKERRKVTVNYRDILTGDKKVKLEGNKWNKSV